MTIKSSYRLVYHQGHPELESLQNNIVSQSIVNYHPISELIKETITRNTSNIILPPENTNIENSINNLININIVFLRIINPLKNSVFLINSSYSKIEWVYYPFGLFDKRYILIYNTGSVFWEGNWGATPFSFDVEYIYYFKNSSTISIKRNELIQVKLYKENNNIKTKLNINNLRPLKNIEVIFPKNYSLQEFSNSNYFLLSTAGLILKIIKETGNIEIYSIPNSLKENPTLITFLIKPIREITFSESSFFEIPPSENPYQNTVFIEENLDFLNQQGSIINYNNITIPENLEYLYFLYNGIGSITVTIKSKVEENEKIKTFCNNHGQLVLVGKKGKDFENSLDLSISGQGAYLKDFVLWGVYNVD